MFLYMPIKDKVSYVDMNVLHLLNVKPSKICMATSTPVSFLRKYYTVVCDQLV